MNSKELYAQLEAAGWMFATAIDQTTGVSWYAYKRLVGGKDCACNDKPPSLCIKPYDLHFGDVHMESVDFEIAGEIAGNKWVSFKVYGVKYDEVLAEAESCTNTLKAAWNAVAG